jgi:hypothetical protein
MFLIGFTQEPLTNPEPGEIARIGLLKLGTWEERFVSHFWTWSEQDYSIHWRHTLGLALEGQPSALITDMRTPQQSSHLICWPMWRIDDDVVFNNRLFFFSHHGVESISGGVETLFKFIGQRRTHDSQNRLISAWTVPTSEIVLFLKS